jgi:hypothetical protein
MSPGLGRRFVSLHARARDAEGMAEQAIICADAPT